MKTKFCFSILLLFLTFSVVAQNQPGYFDFDSVATHDSHYNRTQRSLQKFEALLQDSLTTLEDSISALFMRVFYSHRSYSEEQYKVFSDRLGIMEAGILTFQAHTFTADNMEKQKIASDYNIYLRSKAREFCTLKQIPFLAEKKAVLASSNATDYTTEFIAYLEKE